MKRLSVLLVALLLTLAMTAPAAAMKPTYDFYWEGRFGPEPADEFAGCGFPVEWFGWSSVYKRIWLDDDDFPVKAQVSLQGKATYYNALADQMAVSEQWSWKFHEDNFRIEGDALVWDQRWTGKHWGIKPPKGSPIIHIAGQERGTGTWVWGEPEPSESWFRKVGRDLWDEDAFCEALTPPE